MRWQIDDLARSSKAETISIVSPAKSITLYQKFVLNIILCSRNGIMFVENNAGVNSWPGWALNETIDLTREKVEHPPSRENALCKFCPFSRGIPLFQKQRYNYHSDYQWFLWERFPVKPGMTRGRFRVKPGMRKGACARCIGQAQQLAE